MARGDLSTSIDCLEDLTQAIEAHDELSATLLRKVALRLTRQVPA